MTALREPLRSMAILGPLGSLLAIGFVIAALFFSLVSSGSPRQKEKGEEKGN